MMPNGKGHENFRLARTGPRSGSKTGIRHVLACVDTSQLAEAVVGHAATMAGIMNCRLTILRALDDNGAREKPVDPVEWDLAQKDTQRELDRLASQVETVPDVATAICHGRAADRICWWANEHGVDLIVLGTTGAHNWKMGGAFGEALGLGGTARHVAENVSVSVMLVPESRSTAAGEAARCHRVILPLDSSSQAEASLPVAIQIAEAEKAELLLVHAVPDVCLTRCGPLEPEAIELRDRLRRRNEHAAHGYLSRVQALTPKTAFRTRTRVLSEGDPRQALANMLEHEGDGLLVLSSRALSRLTDLAIGSTAQFLMARAKMPVLLIRADGNVRTRAHAHTESAPMERQPGAIFS